MGVVWRASSRPPFDSISPTSARAHTPLLAESRDCRTVQQMAGATAALPGMMSTARGTAPVVADGPAQTAARRDSFSCQLSVIGYGIAFDGLMHTKLTPVVAGVDGRGCRLWPWGENGVRVSAGEAEAGAGVWHRLDTVPMAWWMELQPSEVFDLLVAASPRLVADNVGTVLRPATNPRHIACGALTLSRLLHRSCVSVGSQTSRQGRVCNVGGASLGRAPRLGFVRW